MRREAVTVEVFSPGERVISRASAMPRRGRIEAALTNNRYRVRLDGWAVAAVLDARHLTREGGEG